MKFAVIIKILQITGIQISTAQHYRISDIKGRFLFYCVCSWGVEAGGVQEGRYAVRKIMQPERRKNKHAYTVGVT